MSKKRAQKLSNFKGVGLKWTFIDTFLRLRRGTTEGRCFLKTQQLAGSCVATQTSKGDRVSGDISSQVTGDFGVLSVFPRPWNERNQPNSAMPREAVACQQGWP